MSERATSLKTVSTTSFIEEATTVVTVRPGGDELSQWRHRYAPELMGDDPRLVEVVRVLRCVADTDCTVLVHGESGTGKELVARALHVGSERREHAFVALNCAAVPEALIEAELFGHVRGAFTGAQSQRAGVLVSANGGTLFLDEIGDMPLSAQAKLLRVLQEREVTPVGSDQSVPINVRVVAATNRDLEAMVKAGTFRGDLYFRINVIPISLPPLRDRGEDVIHLAQRFIDRANRKMNRHVRGLDASAKASLLQYAWPGNVRQLQNMMDRAVALTSGGLISADALPIDQTGAMVSSAFRTLPALELPEQDLNLREAIDRVERALIGRALERTGGNRTEAAALLGLNRTTLIEKIRRFAP